VLFVVITIKTCNICIPNIILIKVLFICCYYRKVNFVSSFSSILYAV
jgi:hypothetical protein